MLSNGPLVACLLSNGLPAVRRPNGTNGIRWKRGTPGVAHPSARRVILSASSEFRAPLTSPSAASGRVDGWTAMASAQVQVDDDVRDEAEALLRSM